MFFTFKKSLSNKYVSACPSSLYRDGGFYDPANLLEQLIKLESLFDIQRISELYPPFAYKRHMPDSILINTLPFFEKIDFKTLLIKNYENLNNEYNLGAACALVKMNDVILTRNSLYLKSGKEFKILYENHRPPDRPNTKIKSAFSNLFRRFKNIETRNQINIYIGSVGSSNYGHWLVDDLPRLKALEYFSENYPNTEIVIHMPESAEAMQKVKRQSISLITKNQRVNVRFFNTKNLLLFDALYYVTPNSYHPSLKSPDSIQYIRDSFVKQNEITQHQDKIFVMRLAKRGRALTNEEAIKKYLEKNGFVSVDPESLELKDQIAVFSSAKIVIGIMGAAMTNTTFCAPDTDVIYLAPQGWMEPFYWDLANVVKQRYHVIYGINQKNNLQPHERFFEITLDSLESLLRKIL